MRDSLQHVYTADGTIRITDSDQLAMVSQIPVAYNEVRGIGFRIRIGSGKSVQSGAVQSAGFFNPNRTAGRFLFELQFEAAYALSELEGSELEGELSGETTLLLLTDGESAPRIQAFAGQFRETLNQEYAELEGSIYVTAEEEGLQEQPCLNATALSRVTFYLSQVPEGVLKTNCQIPSLVESAAHLGVLQLTPKELFSVSNIRDTSESRRQSVCDRLQYLCEFLGGECRLEDAEGTWIFTPDQGDAAGKLLELLDGAEE